MILLLLLLLRPGGLHLARRKSKPLGLHWESLTHLIPIYIGLPPKGRHLPALWSTHRVRHLGSARRKETWRSHVMPPKLARMHMHHARHGPSLRGCRAKRRWSQRGLHPLPQMGRD